MVLDALADASGISFTTERYGSTTEYRYKGRTLLLLKPSTYVNLSGKAVNYWLQKAAIPVENLLVILDDIALPLGTLRLRPSGNDGGHNGLTSIIETLNTKEFARLRIGIGNDYPIGTQVEFVLGKWAATEMTILSEKIPVCHQIIQSFVTQGLGPTMNAYNRK